MEPDTGRRSSAYKAAMGRSAESVMNGSKSGLLYKQGHKVKNWKRRWFSLCEKRLYYFEPAHSGDARPCGVVLLDGYIVELVDDPKLMKKLLKRGNKGITLFRLWHPRKPEYLLCADSEAEMEEWIGAILIEQHRHQANRLTVVQDRKPGASSRNRVAHQSPSHTDGGHITPQSGRIDALTAAHEPTHHHHQPYHTSFSNNGQATASVAFPSSRRDLLPHRAPPPVPTAAPAITGFDGARGSGGNQAQQLRCAKCGAAVSAAASKFCRDCGTPFNPPPLPKRVAGPSTTSSSSSSSSSSAPPLPPHTHRTVQPSYSAVAAAPPPLPVRHQPPAYKTPYTFFPSPTTAAAATTTTTSTSGPPLPARVSPAHTSSSLSPRKTPPTASAPHYTRAAPPVPAASKQPNTFAKVAAPAPAPAPVLTQPPVTAVRPAPAVPAAATAPAAAVPKRLSPKAAPTMLHNSNVRLSAFGGLPQVKPAVVLPLATPPAATMATTTTTKPSPSPTVAAPAAAPAVAVKTITPSPAPPVAAAAPATATPRHGNAAKPDQREQMRQAIQVQAAREKEMRQKVMQRMNEKQELKKTQQLEEKRQQQQASGGHPPPAVPSEVKALSDKLTRIEDEIERASDTQILKGKGAELNDSLKALKDDILRARQKHPQVTGDLVERYNKLSKSVPARVNEVFAVQNSQNAQQRPPVKTMNANCSKCGSKLSGDVVEVAGMHFHRGCFGCAGCGRKLERTCLNIGDKPYCDACGKQAFIRHTLSPGAPAK